MSWQKGTRQVENGAMDEYLPLCTKVGEYPKENALSYYELDKSVLGPLCVSRGWFRFCSMNSVDGRDNLGIC